MNISRRFNATFDSNWPASGHVTIRSLSRQSPHWKGEIASVELLGSKDVVGFSRDDLGLRVDLPATRPGPHAFVLRISGH